MLESHCLFCSKFLPRYQSGHLTEMVSHQMHQYVRIHESADCLTGSKSSCMTNLRFASAVHSVSTVIAGPDVVGAFDLDVLHHFKQPPISKSLCEFCTSWVRKCFTYLAWSIFIRNCTGTKPEVALFSICRWSKCLIIISHFMGAIFLHGLV